MDASPSSDASFPSAFDPLTIADVLSAKSSASLEDARGTPPMSVVAVEEGATLFEGLQELSLSRVKSVPVRAKTSGAILGFFDASIALREALGAASDPASRDAPCALAKRVCDVIHPSLVSGRRGDGGSLPFAFGNLPLREIVNERGYLLYETHSDEPVGSGGSWWFNAEVHRLAVVDARRATKTTRGPRESDDETARAVEWDEIVDVVSQMDVVRCLVSALDSADSSNDTFPTLRAAMREPASDLARRPFCTFVDAPVGEAFADMLREGFAAACVVTPRKHTMSHAGDASLWRAVDTLSVSDFALGAHREVVAVAARGSRGSPSDDLEIDAAIGRDRVDALRPLSDGGVTVGAFLSKVRGADAPGQVSALDESATVLDAARQMTDRREHRAWIVDAAECPVGVVTCTDILAGVAAAGVRLEAARAAGAGPVVEEVDDEDDETAKREGASGREAAAGA